MADLSAYDNSHPMNGLYFKNSDGKKDADVDALRVNCMSTNSYMILRNKYPEKKNLLNIYLDDLNFSLSVGEEGKLSLIYNEGRELYNTMANLFSLVAKFMKVKAKKQ